MEDNTHPQQFKRNDTEDINLQNTPPTQPVKSRKWLYVTLFLGFLVLLIVGVWVLFFRQADVPNLPSEEEPVQENNASTPQIDTTQIESSVLTWIEGMKASESAMFSSREECTAQESCTKLLPEQSIVADWALFKSGSEASMSSVLENYTQVETGSCKFLYDLAHSGDFSEQETEKLNNLCTAVVTSPAPATTVSQNEIITKMQEIISAQATESATIFQTVGDLKTLSLLASDNAVSALWNNTEKESAQSLFNEALTSYIQSNEGVSGAPYLALAALDIYKLTNTPKYLEFAEYIYNTHVTFECTDLTYCTDFLYLTQRLEEATGGAQYTQYMNVVAQSILEQFYDGADFANIYGKGAFYMQENNLTAYPLRENSMLLGIFSQN